jgi:hypothetical protein
MRTFPPFFASQKRVLWFTELWVKKIAEKNCPWRRVISDKKKMVMYQEGLKALSTCKLYVRVCPKVKRPTKKSRPNKKMQATVSTDLEALKALPTPSPMFHFWKFFKNDFKTVFEQNFEIFFGVRGKIFEKTQNSKILQK